MVQGQNQNARDDKIQEFVGGTVHLIEASLSDGDGDTELQAATEASQTTAAGDWSVTHDNVAGTSTLENAEVIDFGSQTDYTVNQIVVQSTVDVDELLLHDGDGSELTGEETSLDPGDLTYTLGAE